MATPSAAPSATHKRWDCHASHLSHLMLWTLTLPRGHLWGGDMCQRNTLPSPWCPNISPSKEGQFPKSQGDRAIAQFQPLQNTPNVCTGEDQVTLWTYRGWVHQCVWVQATCKGWSCSPHLGDGREKLLTNFPRMSCISVRWGMMNVLSN